MTPPFTWPARFTCPDCGVVSHHPRDIEQQYCAGCRTFPEARLARRIVQLAELRPCLTGETLGAFGVVMLLATQTLVRGTDQSRALCARALGAILTADDMPARLRGAADDARWLGLERQLLRQADYNRAMEEIERHWPGINDDGTTP